MKIIEGGLCAPKGFRASGIHCGIRKNRTKNDLALICSDSACSAAAVYTTNLVKGAPLTVTKKHLENGIAKAVIVNSGNANTCNANGIQVAEEMCALAAKGLGISSEEVLVASTGVIGQPLPLDPIMNGMDRPDADTWHFRLSSLRRQNRTLHLHRDDRLLYSVSTPAWSPHG